MAHRNLAPEDLPEKLRDFLLEEDSLAVHELTRDKSRTGSFMQGGGTREPSFQSRYRGGEELGEFRLLRLIGKGGMGEVWEAEQPSLGRRVALKLVLPGRVDEHGLDLFAREARAGGRLSHPGIVSVYGAGSDDDTHWISMELVEDGSDLRDSLDNFKEQASLPEAYFDEVTELLASIADALQHAHDAGVIHRDIKPRNILITPSNKPKLTDFGLARITDEDALTVTGEFAGTYYYMSPEQAAARRDEIDHRTDVFSLGVVMYELLSLQRPFEGDTLHQVAYKIMFEDAPDLLSLRSRIPASLALICGKALEKNCDRRYPTIAEFADDLRRHLVREPVLARAPGRVRKAGLWVQRNPTKSALLSTGSLALVAISALALRISDEKSRTEDMLARAEAAEADARLEAANALTAQVQEASERAKAEHARAEATQRAEDLQQVAETQAEQLSSLDVQAMGWGMRQGMFEAVREAGERVQQTPEELEQAKEDLQALLAGADFTGLALSTLDEHVFADALETLDDFENQPLVQAQLMQTVATTMRMLGLYARAKEPQEQAVEIRRRVLGDEHPETLDSISDLGTLFLSQGKLDEAEPLYHEALETRGRTLGYEHPDTLTSINDMGSLLQDQGKLFAAEPLFRKALELRRLSLGDEHFDTLTSINNMGILLQDQGKLHEAELLYREALECRRRTLGDDHQDTLTSINSMGSLLLTQGKLDEAEPYLRDALEGQRRMLGSEHPHTLASINDMGGLLFSQGKHVESEQYFRETLEVRRRTLGDEHPFTLDSIYYIGTMFKEQGKLDEAEPFLLAALEGRNRVLGEEHPDSLRTLQHVAQMFRMQGSHAKSEKYFREALSVNRRTTGGEHPSTINAMQVLGAVLLSQGKSGEAELLYQEAVKVCRNTLGDEHPDTLFSINNLGFLFYTQHKLNRAKPLLLEVLKVRRRTLGNDHPLTLDSIYYMGALLYAQRKLNEAKPLLIEALEGRSEALGEEHPDTLRSLHHVALLFRSQGRLDDAEMLSRELIRITAQNSPALEKREALLEEILAEKSGSAIPSTEDEPNTDGG